MAEGYIKIFRKIENWEWASDPNTLVLFIWCVLSANWKPGRFQGEDIPRGSFVTSYASLQAKTGLTKSELETAMKHLLLTGEIKKQIRSKYSIISVQNYDLYQSTSEADEKQIGNSSEADKKQIGSKSEANQKQIGTIEKIKNIEEGNNNKKEIKEKGKKRKVFEEPTLNDVREYIEEMGYSVIPERFFNYYESQGWMVGKNKMKDWKAAVRTWNASNRQKEKPQTTGTPDFVKEWLAEMEQAEREAKNAEQ